MLRFVIRIHTAALPSFLALLGMVQYECSVAATLPLPNGRTNATIDIDGDLDVAKVMTAWLRTIPGIEAVNFIVGVSDR